VSLVKHGQVFFVQHFHISLSLSLAHSLACLCSYLLSVRFAMTAKKSSAHPEGNKVHSKGHFVIFFTFLTFEIAVKSGEWPEL
jgi:hypothetical protein